MKPIILSVLFGMCLLVPCVKSDAQVLLTSYNARLSERDHYNSNGKRLQTPAEIIRQDRANFYEFGYPDPEDGAADYFESKAHRDQLERLVKGSRMTPAVRSLIVSGTPLVHVDVYQTFADVTILSK